MLKLTLLGLLMVMAWAALVVPVPSEPKLSEAGELKSPVAIEIGPFPVGSQQNGNRMNRKRKRSGNASQGAGAGASHYSMARTCTNTDGPIRFTTPRGCCVSWRMVQTGWAGLFGCYIVPHERGAASKNKSGMKLLRDKGFEVVGASGFEPPTSWSGTSVAKILSA